MNLKFGKNPPVYDKRTLQMSKYTAGLGPLPPAVNFISEVPKFPMFGNDTLGDCVAAAAGHMVENWTYNAGKGVVPSESDIIAFYENSGYVPGGPSTDNGWELLPALRNWRSKGIGGHMIAAFVQLKTGDWDELRRAIQLFGNVYIGLVLPDAVVPASGSPDWTTIPWLWRPGMSPDPNNGHCVPGMAYKQTDEGETCHFVSWAAVMVMNRTFYQNTTDEAYAVVSQDWIKANGESPSGFDIDQLLADLQAVTA